MKSYTARMFAGEQSQCVQLASWERQAWGYPALAGNSLWVTWISLFCSLGIYSIRCKLLFLLQHRSQNKKGYTSLRVLAHHWGNTLTKAKMHCAAPTAQFNRTRARQADAKSRGCGFVDYTPLLSCITSSHTSRALLGEVTGLVNKSSPVWAGSVHLVLLQYQGAAHTEFSMAHRTCKGMPQTKA